MMVIMKISNRNVVFSWHICIKINSVAVSCGEILFWLNFRIPRNLFTCVGRL